MAGNSNSGRHAKPAIVHLIQGNPSKKPRQELLAEVNNPIVPVEAPTMPDWFDEDLERIWNEVVADLLILGLITKLDKQILAQYCETVWEYRNFSLKIKEENKKLSSSTGDVQTSSTGYKDISVWRKLRNDAERRANEAGGKLGFSPLARQNLKRPAPQQELFPNEPRDVADKYFS